jgi:hypothetical protein
MLYPDRLNNRISTPLSAAFNTERSVASSAISPHASIIAKKNEEF